MSALAWAKSNRGDPGRRALWLGLLAAVPLLAVAQVLLAYQAAPPVALAAPVGIAVLAGIAWRPMAGVALGLLAVPLEVLDLPLGGFGLTPTEGILLATGGVIVARGLVARAAPPFEPVHRFFALGLGLIAIGIVFAPDVFPIVKTVVMWSAFFAISVFVSRADAARVERLLVCLAVTGGIVALVAILGTGRQELISSGAAATNRAQGSFTHPNQLAFFLVMALPVALGLGLTLRGWVRWATLASAGLCTAALMLTLTRGAIIGAVIALGFMLLWAPFRRLILGLLAVVALFAVFNANTLQNSRELSVVSTRISTIGSDTGKQDNARLQIWATTPRIIADHWVLGVGTGNFQQYSLAYGLSELGFPFEHAHNVPLTIAAELGLPGLVLLLCFYLAVARVALSALRNRSSPLFGVALGVTAGLAGLFVNSMLDFPPGSNPIMATIMIQVGALIALERHLRGPRPGAAVAD